jgi:uncharacterized protein (DUF885 family)
MRCSFPDGLETFSTWKEVTTIHHEGVPGHHLQVSQAIAGQDNLNRWQRLQPLCWVAGHGEGWAVYAEQLIGELGYLDDPGLRLGLLDSQLMNAAVAVLDIGVHLDLEIPKGTGWREGQRWNAEIAWEFLCAHSSWDERQLRFELHRYLGWPGQAPPTSWARGSGSPGQGRSRERAGGAFSLKDCHSRALSLGSMGLDPLREALARI